MIPRQRLAGQLLKGLLHFRVDRMSDLLVSDEPRPPLPADFDPARYVRTIFDMHSGEIRRVTLEFDRHLLNLVQSKRNSLYSRPPCPE